MNNVINESGHVRDVCQKALQKGKKRSSQKKKPLICIPLIRLLSQASAYLIFLFHTVLVDIFSVILLRRSTKKSYTFVSDSHNESDFCLVKSTLNLH